jgi:hypothetical protein
MPVARVPVARGCRCPRVPVARGAGGSEVPVACECGPSGWSGLVLRAVWVKLALAVNC